MSPPAASEIEDVTLQVARSLERAGIPYFLVGSVASSLQGEPRATNDIDFVVRMSEAQIPSLSRELGPEFLVDEDSLREAVRRRTSWNIYFLPLVTKIDLFVGGAGDYGESQFSRRRFVTVGATSGLFVASPEDNVLFKLRWFLKGGETSSSQWRDVLGILRVSHALLDQAYLDRWAADLGVDRLLERARREALPGS